MNDDSMFCKIVADEAPARFLHRDTVFSEIHPLGGREPRWPRG
jgi:hypothetical protein